MKSDVPNRNASQARKLFPHANVVTLDNALRVTLHGQPAKFPLSEALTAHARNSSEAKRGKGKKQKPVQLVLV